jgi:hypothetical protein
MMPKLPEPDAMYRYDFYTSDAVRAIQEEAYKAGMAAERERWASHLRASAARLAPEGKRTNQVDRHVADVLATKATELSEVK